MADTTSGLPKHKELWEMAIRIIEIENNLINHRLTAFLALEGGLVAGLALIWGNFKDTPIQLRLVILGFAIAGGVLAGLVAPGIRAARRQIMAAAVWLKKARESPAYLTRIPYPPPKGGEAKSVICGWAFRGTDYDYGADYELSIVETDPKTLQLGFANFPDVVVVLWGLVFVVTSITFLFK
jgi:hypothetical protein